MQAVEYYNTSVLRARAEAGLVGPGRVGHAAPHASNHAVALHARPAHLGHPSSNDTLYRSNSSLELAPDHGHHHHHQGE